MSLSLREQFPILGRKVNGKKLVYLDNAATAQKPTAVIEAMDRFYLESNANVHRGVHWLSQVASESYERVRGTVAQFLGSHNEKEIIFTSGTTQAVNLVAHSWGEKWVREGDVLVVTRMEHHANFVPWQQLAKRKNARLVIVELDAEGCIDPDSWKKALEQGPRLVAFTWMSNVLGTVNPVAQMATQAKKAGATVFLDAAQGAVHFPFVLGDLGPIDFLAFSAHKLCGPTGVGVLWGREDVLLKMDPYQMGGDMILRVSDQETTWNDLPFRFEAGTPNIAGVIGMGAAIEWAHKEGRERLAALEHDLTKRALAQLLEVKGLSLFGPKEAGSVTRPLRGPVFSFALQGVHPHDLAQFLDQEGIAVRAGHHCAQPLMSCLRVSATTRASFHFYNLPEEITDLVKALEAARRYFQ